MTLMEDYLRVLGLVAGTILALVGVARTPIGRWSRTGYRRLIGDPVSAWFRGQVRDEVHRAIDERLMKPNGGKSLADLAAKHDTTAATVNRIARHLGIEEQ